MRLTGHIRNPDFTSTRIESNPASDEITAETVAAILKIKPSTVADWARRGIIPSYKVGKFRRYSRTDILEWTRAKRAASRSDSP